jgi:hypothetical protein
MVKPYISDGLKKFGTGRFLKKTGSAPAGAELQCSGTSLATIHDCHHISSDYS